MEIVLLIARHTDLKHTRALHCLCKDILHACQALDIWLVKFTEEFPSRPFHPWWTAEENYILQKKYRTRVCLWINRSNLPDVDHIVYKRCPARERLVTLHDDSVESGCDYVRYQQVPINLILTGEYAVFASIFGQNLAHQISFNTLEEASGYIRKNYTERNKEWSLPFQYIVVKLSDLLLEFSMKPDQFTSKHKNKFYFVGISRPERLEPVLASVFRKQ